MDQHTISEQNPVCLARPLHDTVFAWFALIAGYAFCRFLPVSNHTVGGALLIVALFAVTFVILLIRKIKIRVLPIFAAISALAATSSLILSSNSFIHFFAYLYALAAYGYFVYAAAGNGVSRFGDVMIVEWFKSLFILPFCSLYGWPLFRSMFRERNSKHNRFVLKLLLGIGITIIPTIVVFALLSYDRDFVRLFNTLFRFGDVDVFSHLTSLSFAVPLAMYLFGLYRSAVERKGRDMLGEETRQLIADKVKIAPVATVLTAVLPLLGLYVLFFVSQWNYYVSGFTGVLPTDFSYANYAREGFFQLCTVSVINLSVIVAILVFTKRSGSASIAVKILTVIFSVFTLILISTAIAKMVMYIDCYGLTQKRVYATWLMAVLTIVFIIMALSRFVPKLKVASLSVAVLILSFTGLALCNADALIARYNVDRYIDGSLETVDVSAVDDLGDAAIPEMVRLALYMDEQNGTNIRLVDPADCDDQTDLYNRLVCYLRRACSDSDLQSFTVNSARARAALQSIGYLQ